MKKYIIGLMLVVCCLFVFGYDNVNDKNDNDHSKGLEHNQIELYYMYTNEDGTFLLDGNADTENVIYVSHDDMVEWIGSDYVNELHHGNKLIGTFDDDGWELVGLTTKY